MERVGGDDVPGNVQRRQQVAQSGDLMGFDLPRDLAQPLAGARGLHGARPRPMHRAPQALPVDRAGLARAAGIGVQPGADRGIDSVGIDLLQDAAQRGFARHLIGVAPTRTPEPAAPVQFKVVRSSIVGVPPIKAGVRNRARSGAAPSGLRGRTQICWGWSWRT